MSDIMVEVVRIDNIQKHPNPEVTALDLVTVKGWQCVIKRGSFKIGDLAIFVQPDSVLPESLADEWGVKSYLTSSLRVKAIKLKGEPSFGLLMPCTLPSVAEGDDVKDILGITKYIPPQKNSGKVGSKTGQKANHPLWVKYTDIQNIRNINVPFEDGEETVALEKIHGSFCNLGYLDGEFFVSSRNHNRHEPVKYIKPSRFRKILTLGLAKPRKIVYNEAKLTDPFWYPSTLDSVNNLLTHLYLRNEHKIIILCGEVFGPIQNLSYGSSDQLQFRAFDLYLDNNYVPYDTFVYYCNRFNVPIAPLVYRGSYDFKVLKELANQKTRIGSDPNQISEGLVIKSTSESRHPKYGRRCFKLISDDYYIMQYGKNPPTDFEE